MRRLLSAGAYLPWVQGLGFCLEFIFNTDAGLLAPAQYWHDPLNRASYVSKGDAEDGTFDQTSSPSPARYLPLINNARDAKSASIREGITRLRLFVMIMWRNDTMVTPRESSHFQFYRSGQVFLPLFLAISSGP